MAKLRMLEFYSGIGGMHYASALAQWDVEILKAFDINNIANDVYKHNFGTKTVAQRQIEALTVEYYNKCAADVWTMSPPCQPYTRTGLQQGSEDNRSKSFLYLLKVLEEMENRPKYILVENVKGFEESDSRDMLVQSLEKCGYGYQEFLLTPLQLSIPNSRMRYYLLAKQKPLTFARPPTGTILGYIPYSTHVSTEFIDNRTKPITTEQDLVGAEMPIEPISHYLEANVDTMYLVTDKVLSKHGHVFDIVKPDSHRSCCFTKGYYHYAEATGSILQMNPEADTHAVFEEAAKAKSEGSTEKQLELLRSLKLRYFTPREVANLMGFPKEFSFPETTSLKQKYRTLGNSINVKLVAELMVYLMKSNTE